MMQYLFNSLGKSISVSKQKRMLNQEDTFHDKYHYDI